MVNMKLILLVSLVVVIAEAVPIQETGHSLAEAVPIQETGHSLVKRGLFDDIMDTARRHLETASAAAQRHLEAARAHLHQTSEHLRTHHENARERLDQIGSQLGEHVGTVRDHLQDLAENAGLDFGDDDVEDTVDETEPVIDLS